jgi:hypothetical protein
MHKMQTALGRTREGKKSSSWCWLQLFSAARLVRRGLHSQPFAALAGLLVLAGTTATGPLSDRWSTGLGRGGSLGPSKREKCEQGFSLPPWSQPPVFYARLYLRRPLDGSLNSILSTTVQSRGRREARRMLCQFQLPLQRQPFRTIFCAPFRYGNMDCWFANCK